jgi:phosphoglycolate phosphatase-like HAD superfamily hydrolase
VRELRRSGTPVAIATGDWRETVSFKLTSAGIPFHDIPMVTSSEFYSRADIISEAVSRAGGRLADCIYVGDGLWDLRACLQIGMPFIGVGRRSERLRSAGAVHVLENLAPGEFLALMEAMKKTNHAETRHTRRSQLLLPRDRTSPPGTRKDT